MNKDNDNYNCSPDDRLPNKAAKITQMLVAGVRSHNGGNDNFGRTKGTSKEIENPGVSLSLCSNVHI